MKKVLTGPHGIELVLDSDQIFPDDPGAGTPAMVYWKGHDATYGCAVVTGELDGGYCELMQVQINWLSQQDELVWNFLDEHGG